MSESPSNFSFPHRTPVFTTVCVLVCFALFGWLAWKYYVPHAYAVAKIEGVKLPEDRRALLQEHRQKEHEELTTYGWVDRKAGVVRLPIDRAIELVAREHARK
jgi:TRAP-type C4-dicarboxylate transport system permease small subunit